MTGNAHIHNVDVTRDKWSLMSRIFHWVSLVLLILTWLMIVLHENSEGFTYISLHKAFGVSVLLWTLARLINRIYVKSPLTVPMPTWQTALAHGTHFALYVLLLAMPIAGMLMSWYGGRAISMFGLFDIPVMVTPDRSLARYFNNLHTDIIWPTLLLFTALHVAGALYHQFVKKDNLISRMR